MANEQQQPGSRRLVRGRTFVGGVVVGLAVNAISDAYQGAGGLGSVRVLLRRSGLLVTDEPHGDVGSVDWAAMTWQGA